jgi:hypothetical protein
LRPKGSKFVKVCCAILILFFVGMGLFMLVEKEWEAAAGALACTVLPTYYLVTRRAPSGTK